MSTVSTIKATVNSRLLTKASRLFTGSQAGRIIEILQNARRAGATIVHVTNDDDMIIVRDNGRGIDDFADLLDMGGSGWDDELEASEDPAGVGLFCLAPRELTVRSRGRLVHITRSGWAGEPVGVRKDSLGLGACGKITVGAGTELRFMDEAWTFDLVSPHAVFSGVQVYVDAEACPRESFIVGEATEYPELGCRVQVTVDSDLTLRHRDICPNSHALLNFHGQVVSATDWNLQSTKLHFRVEMTGQPTGIRLMLPARTQVVENEALKQLEAVLEREAYLYIQRQGSHHLYYAEYLRAKELGIELPEAKPTYRVGLIVEIDSPSPVDVDMPAQLPLIACYQMNDAVNIAAEANAHLLAALGKFDQRFVPVTIDSRYAGYSWAKLPTIDEVEVSAGEVLQESMLGCGTLYCVKSLSIAVRCSNGQRFASEVPMAVQPSDDVTRWHDEHVYVTAAARGLPTEAIWYHLGGYSEDGDSYDTQLHGFIEELDAFWTQLAGPDEELRCKLMESLRGLRAWRSVTVTPDGQVKILHKDGAEQVLTPPM